MLEFKEFVKKYMNESTEELNEASVVTFDNKTFPTNGWCVVLAGGPGSGKGFQQKDSIMIDAKVFDVDELKTLYVKAAQKGLIDDENKGEYNFKNPDDVFKLHKIVKNKDYDTKRKKYFFNANTKKPNVIYDITGKDIEDYKNIYEKVKQFDYKTSLIWVVTNRDVALIQTLLRKRVVPQKIFHTIHNQIKELLPDFIKKEAGEYFDECWILFSSTKKMPQDMTDEERKELKDDRAFKLEKHENGFEISEQLENRIYDILGATEEKPENPVNYKNYATIQDELKQKPITRKKKPDLKQFFTKNA